MPELHDHVKQLLTARWPEAARFVERAEKDLQGPPGVGFRALFASVPRRLGPAVVAAAGENVEAPAELRAVARSHWSAVDYARLWLVLRALPLVKAEQQAGWVLELFEAGELGEQVSILRLLGALPNPERFVETGVQACRNNTRDVFEAIVCENAFLSGHFPSLNFNQAIMKAIFMEVSVQRVEALASRITPELSRMAAGYASERRAAGRPVPADAEFLSHYGAK